MSEINLWEIESELPFELIWTRRAEALWPDRCVRQRSSCPRDW